MIPFALTEKPHVNVSNVGHRRVEANPTGCEGYKNYGVRKLSASKGQNAGDSIERCRPGILSEIVR